MNYIKLISKPLLYFLGSFLILSIVITLFNYFNIMNYKIINIFKFLVPYISIFISSLVLGNNSERGGYIKGIKYGIIISIIIIFINILTNSFKVTNILYIAITIFLSAVGSIIGINKRHINEK